MPTEIKIADGQQLEIWSQDNAKVAILKTLSDRIAFYFGSTPATATEVFSLSDNEDLFLSNGTDIIFEGASHTISAIGSGVITIGSVGNTVNLNVSGVNYNLRSPMVTEGITIGSGSLTLPGSGYSGAGQIQSTGTVRIANGSSAQGMYVKEICVTDSWSDADSNKLTNGIYSKGGMRTAGQIISTVATGTAPMSITSTTKVNNLNVDMVDGCHSTDFAAANHTHDYTTLTNKPLYVGSTAPSSPTLYMLWVDTSV